MSRDKQNEIHELAKQMSEAISTAVEQRYIEDEAKLQAVLIENGWRKASEVAREIFEEIENAREECIHIDPSTNIGYLLQSKFEHKLAELKKKYTGSKEVFPAYVQMGAKALLAILNVKYTESENDDDN